MHGLAEDVRKCINVCALVLCMLICQESNSKPGTKPMQILTLLMCKPFGCRISSDYPDRNTAT